jgi:hypothetical protein
MNTESELCLVLLILLAAVAGGVAGYTMRHIFGFKFGWLRSTVLVRHRGIVVVNLG